DDDTTAFLHLCFCNYNDLLGCDGYHPKVSWLDEVDDDDDDLFSHLTRREIILDPNGQSEDGTTALRAYEINHDARYLAYGVSSSGSDWLTVRVMRVDERYATINTEKK
ncbi:prolyl endopeptidase-like protein, partial [Tanacetum coccineum]